jgi:hypothetical protein
VPLKKDELMRHERRLSAAVQLLSFAQQTYMMYCNLRHNPHETKFANVTTRSLQRAQPEQIISALILALESSGIGGASAHGGQLITASAPSVDKVEEDLNTSQSLQGSRSDNASLHRPQSKSHSSRARFEGHNLPTKFKFGLANWTGTIEVCVAETAGDKATRIRKSQEQSEQPFLAVKIRMPTWLCYRTLQSTIHQCQSGWMHYFRIRTVYPWDSPRWRLLASLTKRDDVLSLQRELQGAEWSPEDCDEYGTDLIWVSLMDD